MANFDIRREGECVMVIPAGDMIASATAELRPVLRDLVRGGLQKLVIDLTRAEMMDSTGIGLLLAAYNSVSQAGAALEVCGASAGILELLRAMRVHQHFPVTGRGDVARGDGQ